MTGAYVVVLVRTRYASMEEALQRSPGELAAHIERSKGLHADGKLVMAGAFLDKPEEPVTTMAVLHTREDAEEYLAGDPFALAGMVESFEIRPWADMLGGSR